MPSTLPSPVSKYPLVSFAIFMFLKLLTCASMYFQLLIFFSVGYFWQIWTSQLPDLARTYVLFQEINNSNGWLFTLQASKKFLRTEANFIINNELCGLPHARLKQNNPRQDKSILCLKILLLWPGIINQNQQSKAT